MQLIRSPAKERRSWTTDSRRWAYYKPRPDDIVIATSPKCGTTWMQQIVSLLIFQSAEARDIQNESPWIDMRVRPIEEVTERIEAQTHRRFLKTHLEFDAVPVYDSVHYIHVARDGRDAFMSWYNHSRHYSQLSIDLQSAAGISDETIGKPLPLPGDSIREFFQVWMTDGPEARLANDFPAERYFEIEGSYWAERERPNLLMVHYNDLLADLNGEMRRIAQFLDIHVPEEQWPALVDAATFHFMRENGAALMPRAAQGWDQGGERFLHAGTNGRWRDVLSADDIALYDARVRRELSPNLARWLEQGSRLAGDPRQMAD
ncbi:MAG TPA: sulfotransferase domain-containing protein [Rhizomicrobium sp.]|jgi:aryl sulfotransferase|nr:sulfotransferase domain-containing protein [Rhizomicrobium sp.]